MISNKRRNNIRKSQSQSNFSSVKDTSMYVQSMQDLSDVCLTTSIKLPANNKINSKSKDRLAIDTDLEHESLVLRHIAKPRIANL